MTPLREAMEKRRLEAAAEIRVGVKSCVICQRYGISRATLPRWRKRLDAGSDLKGTDSPGRPSKLTWEQKVQIQAVYWYGVYTGLTWSTAEFRDAIKQRFEVEYSVGQVGRLMHKLGLPVAKRGFRGRAKRPVGGPSASTVNEPTHPARVF